MAMMGSQDRPMQKDEWLTPPHIFKALGSFDLDPCAAIEQPWSTAARHYTIEENGLKRHWCGRVWMNPPYGKETGYWLARLSHHGNGIALVFARTDTKMFFSEVWGKAHAVLFLKGRLFFHHIDGSRASDDSGAPSVLVAYGEGNADCLKNCDLSGMYVDVLRHEAVQMQQRLDFK